MHGEKERILLFPPSLCRVVWADLCRLFDVVGAHVFFSLQLFPLDEDYASAFSAYMSVKERDVRKATMVSLSVGCVNCVFLVCVESVGQELNAEKKGVVLFGGSW